MPKNSVTKPKEEHYHYKTTDRDLRLFAVGASPAVLWYRLIITYLCTQTGYITPSLPTTLSLVCIINVLKQNMRVVALCKKMGTTSVQLYFAVFSSRSLASIILYEDWTNVRIRNCLSFELTLLPKGGRFVYLAANLWYCRTVDDFPYDRPL